MVTNIVLEKAWKQCTSYCWFWNETSSCWGHPVPCGIHPALIHQLLMQATVCGPSKVGHSIGNAAKRKN